MNLKSGIFMLLLSMAFASCTKHDPANVTPDGNGQSATPVKRPLGQATGPAVVKQIGPEGGSLASADGRIQLMVPAGAVSSHVNFSIQPVENTLEGSPGKAFRLLPEGMAFAKPVTITYAFNGAELQGAIPEALYLAYQNREGYHYLAANTVLDAAARKLTVQTTHFSDWTVAELLEVVVDTTQVPTGGKANLKLMWQMGALLAPLTEDQPIGDLVDYNGYVSKVKWSLAAGKGSIQASGIKCVYQAPDKVPAENPAFVSVSAPITMYDSKRIGQTILTTQILTVPDEYLVMSVDGQSMINKAPENGESALSMEADKFYVTTQMSNGHGIYILVPGGVTGTGSYPYGEDEKQGYIDYTAGSGIQDSYITMKKDCEECDVVYSGGHVKITRFGGIGEYVEGEFAAEVWQLGSYSPPKKNITGKFRVKRTI